MSFFFNVHKRFSLDRNKKFFHCGVFRVENGCSSTLSLLALSFILTNIYITEYFPMFILGLQPRDKAAMLVVNTKEIFLLNLHQNRVHFPAERNAFVLDHQHGRRDVTCKPAIITLRLTIYSCQQKAAEAEILTELIEFA